MPRGGKKLSGACYACLRKKVKCDEAKPSCERCQRSGGDCPGYREDHSIFRSMNEVSERKVLNAKSRRAVERKSQIPTPDEGGTERSPKSLTLRYAPSQSLPASVVVGIDQQAIDYFFNNFVQARDPRVGTSGQYEFLPDLCIENSGTNHLSEAIKAVALFNLANRSSLGYLAQRARRSYGNALVSVNRALNDQSAALSDQTLATLSLLGTYEVCCSVFLRVQTLTSSDCEWGEASWNSMAQPPWWSGRSIAASRTKSIRDGTW